MQFHTFSVLGEKIEKGQFSAKRYQEVNRLWASFCDGIKCDDLLASAFQWRMIQSLKDIGYILGLTEADQAFNWDYAKLTKANWQKYYWG